MHVVTGTPDTRTEHSTEAATIGTTVAMLIPAAIGIIGLAIYGWSAISWPAAILWGLVATGAMTFFMVAAKAMGATKFDLAELIGSVFAPAHSQSSRLIGTVIHFVNGVLLSLAFVYGARLAGLPANGWTGLLWGALVWACSLLLLTSIGGVHPAIRRGEEEDPGTAAMKLGRFTPVGALAAHLVWGLVLGGLYAGLPLI